MLKKWQPQKGLKAIQEWFHKDRFFEDTVSYSEIYHHLIQKILLYNIDQRAAAVAFHFTLSVFPTILFLFTLIPYFPIPNLEQNVMAFLHQVMPKGLYFFAEHTIRDIVGIPHGGILSFGAFLALFSATNGMSAIMTSFNIADNTPERRNYFKARWIALWLTLLLALVLLLAVIIIFIGGFIVTVLNDTVLQNNDLAIFMINLLRFVVIFGSFLLAVSVIYKFAPKRKHRWRLFNVGVWVASLLIILATFAFSYYLSKFDSYNKLYGSIGTIIALMYWFYLIALLLIFGFELNLSIWNVKREEMGKK